MKLKIILSSLIIGVFALFGTGKVLAADIVNLYLFWGDGCPHCAKEKEFLNKLVKEDKDIILHSYEVYKDDVGRAKLVEASEKLGVDINGVPFLIIGDKYVTGYMNEETTGEEIKRLIKEHRDNGCFDIFTMSSSVVDDNPVEEKDDEECIPYDNQSNISLPKIGNIDLGKLSLPALTVALGFLDGFNPCAMWVLLFLISLLLGMQDKKKMWVLGVAFIVSSAFVYFLFMVAWLNLFQFIGFISWVRIAIAGIAFVGGYASLRKFLSKDPDGCDVSDSEKKTKIFEKLGSVTSNKSFFLALIGIIGLAFAVNLVELVCSAGLPAVYTQVLALNEMEGSGYYMYILLYILFFMLDDLFVFFVAMTTLQMTGITTKYVKYTRLVGGILMLIIGFLLLFKPELLMFG